MHNYTVLNKHTDGKKIDFENNCKVSNKHYTLGKTEEEIYRILKLFDTGIQNTVQNQKTIWVLVMILQSHANIYGKFSGNGCQKVYIFLSGSLLP